MQGFLSNGHTSSLIGRLLSYLALHAFREIAVRHDRRARANIPLRPGFSLHFAKRQALLSIMDGRTWEKKRNIDIVSGATWSFQQVIRSWTTGTQEKSRIAAAIMVCSFMVFLRFTQEKRRIRV